jgi:hypothetical protein
MLVLCDVPHANAVQIVDRRSKTDGVRNIAGPRFKARRRWLIDRFFESHVRYHVAATLVRRHVIEEITLTVNYAYACLCPENTKKSASSSWTLIGVCGMDCAPSTSTLAPERCASSTIFWSES